MYQPEEPNTGLNSKMPSQIDKITSVTAGGKFQIYTSM